MRHKHDDPVRITSAAKGRSEDLSHRQRRYIEAMTIRTVCFVLAVVFMPHWIMWVFVAGAVVLPYVAVVVANGGAAPDPGGPDPFLNQDDKRQIES